MEALIPDPFQMAILMVWFVVMYALLKKLLFDPYLEVLDRRHADTGGAQGEFSELRANIEQAEQQRKQILDQARDQALQVRQQILQQATTEADGITGKAQQDAQAKLKAARDQIAAEKAKLDSELSAAVQPLTSLAVAKLTGSAA